MLILTITKDDPITIGDATIHLKGEDQVRLAHQCAEGSFSAAAEGEGKRVVRLRPRHPWIVPPWSSRQS